MAAFEPKTAVAIEVAAGVSVCAYLAASVFAPLVCAPFHFIIALVWPLQSRLQLTMPKFLALAIAIFLTVAVCLPLLHLPFGALAGLDISSSRTPRDIRRSITRWWPVAALWAQHFNVGWLFRRARKSAAQGYFYPAQVNGRLYPTPSAQIQNDAMPVP